MVKIASPELNFTSLLEEVASWKLPTLLSTGVSKISDITYAVELFMESTNIPKTRNIKSLAHAIATDIHVCLLHCVTAYPAPETDYNLRVLPSLSAVFGLPVGVSDHSSGIELVPALAVSMGAVVIEKHFCLSRDDDGLDDPIALEPQEFSQMAAAVRNAAEWGAEKTIAFYKRRYGSRFVEQILGDGIKKLAPSEKDNYPFTNRSIHALRDIHPGEIIKKRDFAVLRSEKNLRPGLDPCWEKSLVGRTAKKFIPAGEGIRFEDV